MAKKTDTRRTGKDTARADGRVAFFTYMKPETKEGVKQAATEEGLRAWQFIERAVQKALKSRRKAGS